MGAQVCAGAVLACSFGTTPSTLIVKPTATPVLVGAAPLATIEDHVPIANIPPFGLCSSLANPTVQAATTAAHGELTPMPCVPVIPAPWAPGVPALLVNGVPGVTGSCQCQCTWAGIISVTSPGQLSLIMP